MSNLVKPLLFLLLCLFPNVFLAQSCAKDNSELNISDKMKQRAIDFKNVIQTNSEIGLRSSTYIYSSRTIKKYLNNPQELVSKLALLGFTDVYISFDKPGTLYIDLGWYKVFNKLAHENNIKIHALSLSNLQLYVSDALVKTDIDWVKDYNNSVGPTERFDGLSADLEPHILKLEYPNRPAGLTLAWNSETSYGIGKDNDLLLKRTVEVMSLAKNEKGSLTLNEALGFFFQPRFDTGILSWGGAQQFLQYCDQVVVMAYNYQAKRVVEMATPLLVAAADYPRSVSVAVKTSLNTVGNDGPLTSFQPQGWDNLITSLEYIVKECKKYNTFRGMDFFEFAGFEIMWESE